MKYLIHGEVDPAVAPSVEANPERIQAWIAKWQELDVLGMWFSLSRRAYFIAVDVEDEDAMFGQLWETWNLIQGYPRIDAVLDVEEFPQALARVGLLG